MKNNRLLALGLALALISPLTTVNSYAQIAYHPLPRPPYMPSTQWKNMHKELEQAIKTGQKGKAIDLLSKGASINFQNDEGDTPLHWAAKNLNIELVQDILEYPNNPLLEYKKNAIADTTIKNKEGKTAEEIINEFVESVEE